MRRRLFIFASVLSALIFLSTTGLWVRSYIFSEGFTWYTAEPGSLRFGQTEIGWARGNLFITFYHARAEDRGGFDTCMQEWKDWRNVNVDSGPIRVHTVLPSYATVHLTGFWGQLGFRYDSSYSTAFKPMAIRSGTTFIEVPLAYEHRQVFIPAWAIALASMLLPGTAVARELKRWRKRREGHCPVCSYDLTGNTSGRCPECGTTIPDTKGALPA